MFNLTLRDHLHLTFTQVSERYNLHIRTAQSHARWSRRLKGAEALMVGGTTIAAVAAAYGRGPATAVAAAVLAGIALVILLMQLTFDFGASAHAHGACGARLWTIRERYRSLLSDLHDGVLDLTEVRMRRDRLMDELRAIHETAPLTMLGDYLPDTEVVTETTQSTVQPIASTPQ